MTKKKMYILAALIPVTFWIIIFIINGIAPFGENTLAVNDAYDQYVNFIELWKNYVTEGIKPYSMQYGLGFETLPMFAYYSLSPFNCLYSLPVRPFVIYGLIVVLKSSLTCLACTFVFSKKYNETSTGILTASIAYTFCGFVANHFYSCIWSDAFLLFPLIFYFLTEYLENNGGKKAMIRYSVFLFIAIQSNFYMSYGICLFIIIIFFSHRFGGFKNMAKKAGTVLTYSLISVGLNGVMLFYTIRYLFSNKAAGEGAVYDFKLHDIFKSFLLGYNETAGTNPYIYLYIGVFWLILLFTALAERKYEHRRKVIFYTVLAFVIALLKPLNVLFHAGDSPNFLFNRFSYMFSFVLIYYLYNLSKTVSRRAFISGCIVALSLTDVVFICIKNQVPSYASIQPGVVIVTIIFIVIYFIIMMTDRRKYIPAVIIFEVFMNILMITGSYEYSPAIESNQKAVSKYQRIESINTQNSYCGQIGFFASTTNKRLSRFLSPLLKSTGDGYIKSNPYNYFVSSILGESGVLNNKGFMDAGGGGYEKDGQEIFKYKYPLSVGFAIKNDIRSINLPDDMVKANNMLFQMMTGTSSEIFTDPDTDVSKDGDEYKIRFNRDYDKILVTTSCSIVRLQLNGKEMNPDLNDAVHFCFNNIKAGDEICLTKNHYENLIVDMFAFHEEVFRIGYKILAENQLDIAEYSDTYISGEITLDHPSYMFFSIGFNKGWKVYIDGNETKDDISINNALYQLYIPEGKHRIEFKYLWKF